MAAVQSCSGFSVTRSIVRTPGRLPLCAAVICDVFLCAYCHNRVRQRLLLREQFGNELEPRLAPWMPSFIIHSNPIWLGTLLWVSHCPSSTLGSLRPRGGKNLSWGCGRQTFRVGDVESILALEMALNSYPLVDRFASSKPPPYQEPPLGPGLRERSLGFKELKSPLYIHTFIFYTSFWLFQIFHTDSPLYI